MPLVHHISNRTTTTPRNDIDSMPDSHSDDADCDCCLPLAVVEVVPLHMVPPTMDGALADPGPPALSAPMVKMQLRDLTAASLATRMVRGMQRRRDRDSGGDRGNSSTSRKRKDKSGNETINEHDDDDQDLVMRISLDIDSLAPASSNSTDKLSKDMEALSLDKTNPLPSLPMSSSSSSSAVQIQPATTRIVGGNIFLFNANWDDAVERRIIDLSNGTDQNAEGRIQMPIIRILSDDPTDFSGGVPCWIRGYAQITEATKVPSRDSIDDNDDPGDALDCAVVAGTLVRILPAITARIASESNNEDSGGWNAVQGKVATIFEGHPTLEGGAPLPLPLFVELSGQVDPYQMRMVKEKQEEIDFILACHDDDAVRGLLVRMQALLEREVLVGTTDDAFALMEARKSRSRRRMASLKSHLLKQSLAPEEASLRQTSGLKSNDATSSGSNLFRDGGLTVHNQYDTCGKTLLVETLARHVLKCSAVHVLDGNTLFAEYGANGADAAFESLLHSIVLSAAVGGGRLVPEHNSSADKRSVPSICIVLDHLEGFVPPSILGLASSGDPAVPALNAMVAYLTKLTNSIKNQGQFPYPSKNPMYNIGGGKGFAMPVRVCIVGIVTVDDDGGRSGIDSPGDSYTILDVLGSNRYRLSHPSAKTRHRAFCRAFEEENIVLSSDAKEALPVLAASTTGARGRNFRKVARDLRSRVTKEGGKSAKMREATAEDVREAMKVVPRDAPKNSTIGITFLSSKIGHKGKMGSKGRDIFATVGGNAEAKLALEDALALDPRQRRLLSSVGLSAPVGVLLYGPPGTCHIRRPWHLQVYLFVEKVRRFTIVFRVSFTQPIFFFLTLFVAYLDAGTGKTLLARATALALESESPIGGAFINLQATDIMMGAVGQSEKLVVSSFELARQNTPAVIFIDEMQSLFVERGGSGSSQLASTLLQCMDDVSRWRDADEKVKEKKAAEGSIGAGEEDVFDVGKGRIIVLAATNVPWMIDKAFLRPGRFDRVVYVGLPTQEERESILRVHIGNMRVADDGKAENIAIAKEALCKLLAKDTDGLSGADLFALCRAAAIRCIRDKDSTVEGGVKESHFLEALQEDIKPSCDENFVRKLVNWNPRGGNIK